MTGRNPSSILILYWRHWLYVSWWKKIASKWKDEHLCLHLQVKLKITRCLCLVLNCPPAGSHVNQTCIMPHICRRLEAMGQSCISQIFFFFKFTWKTLIMHLKTTGTWFMWLKKTVFYLLLDENINSDVLNYGSVPSHLHTWCNHR